MVLIGRESFGTTGRNKVKTEAETKTNQKQKKKKEKTKEKKKNANREGDVVVIVVSVLLSAGLSLVLNASTTIYLYQPISLPTNQPMINQSAYDQPIGLWCRSYVYFMKNQENSWHER